jgi:hypothetical protein
MMKRRGENMLDILNFIFQDFWHWAGITIILGVIAEGIGGMFGRIIVKKD